MSWSSSGCRNLGENSVTLKFSDFVERRPHAGQVSVSATCF